MGERKSEIISRLQESILRLQGCRPMEGHREKIGLGTIEDAFPGGNFPVGSVHEFISGCTEQVAATSGFMGGLLAQLMRQGGVCLWISTSRSLFPPSIKIFGAEPDRIIFVDMKREKDILWATEEALRCEGLAVVVAELREMDFVQSRRLQLAVEKSRVTGFVLRINPKVVGSTACTARWLINPLPSGVEKDMPGVGLYRWEVELLKVRNGNPGRWEMEWSDKKFITVTKAPPRALPSQQQRIG